MRGCILLLIAGARDSESSEKDDEQTESEPTDTQQ